MLNFLTPSLPLRHPHATFNSCQPRRPPTCATMTSANLHIGPIPQRLGEAVRRAADETLATKDTFTLAISGGSLPRQLGEALSEDVDMSKWQAFLADERVVPHHHDDSNVRLIREHLPRLHIVPADTALSPAQCATDYQRLLRDALADAPFDLILLGLGPDGHTCSLFPDHPLLHEDKRQVAEITDSPKPPPERITLTLPVVNSAKRVMFVCGGEGKAEAVKDIIENPSSKLPGARVKATSVDWYLDEAAAKLLTQK